MALRIHHYHLLEQGVAGSATYYRLTDKNMVEDELPLFIENDSNTGDLAANTGDLAANTGDLALNAANPQSPQRESAAIDCVAVCIACS